MYPIPEVTGHPSDPVAVYADLTTSPTTHHKHPLRTMSSGKSTIVLTIRMLVNALRIMLDALHPDTSLYVLHSF